MSYTLYIQNDCEACDEVVHFIKSHHITCAIKDIATHQPPVTRKFGIILPALFWDDVLVAYGPEDIMRTILRPRAEHSSK